MPNLFEKPEIFTAIDAGDVTKVLALIANGADVNERDPDSDATPLHAAAVLGRTAICDTLIAAGADLKLKDCWDDTALSKAIGGGHLDCVKALVAKGAEIEPYHMVLAARGGFVVDCASPHIDVLTWLLEQPDARPDHFWDHSCALVEVLEAQSVEGVALLLKKGASMTTKIPRYLRNETRKPDIWNAVVETTLSPIADDAVGARILETLYECGAFKTEGDGPKWFARQALLRIGQDDRPATIAAAVEVARNMELKDDLLAVGIRLDDEVNAAPALA